MPAIKECVSLHIGQAGCQVGFRSWELFCEEHKINPDGTRGDNFTDIDPNDDAYLGFFHETGTGQHVPRCVMIDTEPTVINDIRVSKMQQLFHPDTLIAFKRDCKANYFEGRQMAQDFQVSDVVIDRLRRVYDLCDNPQGFFVYQSYGGGTGSGVGVAVLKDIRDTFGPKKAIFQPLIYPSKCYSGSIVEPYNCMFATFESHKHRLTDLTIMMDNEAAYNVCINNLHIRSPDFTQVNSLIAQCMSGLTGPLRYDTELNATLDEIQRNLVPMETFRYAIIALSPIRHAERKGHEKFHTSEVVKELFTGKTLLSECRGLTANRYLAAVVILRGEGDADGKDQMDQADSAGRTGVGTTSIGQSKRFTAISPNVVLNALNELRAPPKSKSYTETIRFAPWMKNAGIKVGIVKTRTTVPRGFCMAQPERQGVMLGNNTCVRQLFLRQFVRYLKLLFSKAYMWKFTGTEPDFYADAKEGIENLIKEYEGMVAACASQEAQEAPPAPGSTGSLAATARRR